MLYAPWRDPGSDRPAPGPPALGQSFRPEGHLRPCWGQLWLGLHSRTWGRPGHSWKEWVTQGGSARPWDSPSATPIHRVPTVCPTLR